MEQQFTLVSTLHDPDQRLLPTLIARSELLGHYGAVVLAATENTAPRLLQAIELTGAHMLTGPTGEAGTLQRAGLKLATSVGQAPYFYCDFDRWLHWADRFPDELTSLPALVCGIRPAPWYVCIGRTRRAFDTHPRVQRDAERATNHALSLVLGRKMDATAGACLLSEEGAEIVRDQSMETSKAVDLEWPALVMRSAPDRVASLTVEGLEFETASFYQSEVKDAGGTAAWITRTYDRPEVWRDRLRLAADSIDALVRVRGD